jgi:ribosome-associated translation inhibitor RaiA/cold shock CspA family protein
MQTPLQITFQGLDPSPAIEARIREKVDKLERFHDRITTCQVVVERPPAHSNKGGIYEVRIHLGVPGGHIDVTREPGLNHAHEDIGVALRDAFARATRLLEDHVRKQRGDVKRHDVPPHGRVIRMFPGQDGGFLESSEGLQVYFHRNAVVDGSYDDLNVGDEVRFVLAPEPGDEGPQASTVHPVGKHHVVG